ncbi:MAG TPA: type II toxin-antitoxin system Phd/YefM family antitoxin [Rhizomicrobium sp.]|nr:type II toxin-antitoxin system Phd/YefM family antitoxin [Rhizomicrobium sp.]
MRNVSIADAKAQLSELVERAEAGDQICITRRGKPVAKLAPIERPRKQIDFDALKAFTDSLPKQRESAGAFVRRMRDEDRY